MNQQNTTHRYAHHTLVLSTICAIIIGLSLQACMHSTPTKAQPQASSKQTRASKPEQAAPARTTKPKTTPKSAQSQAANPPKSAQAHPQKPQTQKNPDTPAQKTNTNNNTLNERTPESTESTESTESMESMESMESAPLPLNIKAKDILSSPTLNDNHQHITAKKSFDSGFTFVELYGPAGDLRARLSFKNDVLDGVSTAYQNGQIAREIPYKNGQIDGIVITHIPPDKRLESSYKNGKKHGKTILYHQGTPISSKDYNNGILHGTFETALDLADSSTYQNTNSLTHYHYGKKQGESIGYANGKIVFKQHYNKGVLQGQTQTYGENAIIKISRNYYNGFLHGEEIVYNYPQETPAYKSHYELDVLVAPYENYEANGATYYSIAPKDKAHPVIKGKSTDTQELWLYEASQQVALEITKDSGHKRVRIFHQNGALASDSTITPTQASGSYYTQDSHLESKVLHNASAPLRTTWHYAPQGQLLTKSQESPAKTITQSYRDGALDSEVVVLEGEEITIQKGFFPNGALQFEHHYIEDTMIQGTLYGKDGKVIYSFPHTSKDMIFDEAFPNTAAKRRAKVLPSH